MKVKKRIASISVVLVLACAIVALYMYIDRSGKQAKERKKRKNSKVKAENQAQYC